MPNHIILFKHAGFRGPHKHVFDEAPDLSSDSEFYKSVSSIAIVSGNWTFFGGVNFDGAFPPVLGPGLYGFVGDFDITNDAIVSLRSVQDAPTMPGEPLNAHIILFEHAN